MAATALLQRFFREEGFTTPGETIAANLKRMLAIDHCAVLLAEAEGAAVGVATVSMDFGIEVAGPPSWAISTCCRNIAARDAHARLSRQQRHGCVARGQPATR